MITINYKLNQKTGLISFVLIVLFCSAYAGPDNIAPLAKVTASSMLSNEYAPANIVDDNIHIEQYGEWASKSGITFWSEVDFLFILDQLLVLMGRTCFGK